MYAAVVPIAVRMGLPQDVLTRQQTADSTAVQLYSRQQTPKSRQQPADTKQQTADPGSKQENPDSRQQTADSRSLLENLRARSMVRRKIRHLRMQMVT